VRRRTATNRIPAPWHRPSPRQCPWPERLDCPRRPRRASPSAAPPLLRAAIMRASSAVVRTTLPRWRGPWGR
jgi:hypothetical protein